MPDFFGNEASLDEQNAAMTGAVLRPAQTIEDIQREERQRIADNYARGLDANGNPLPAYGTPISQGGTAQGYQTSQGTGVRSTSFRPDGSSYTPTPLNRAPVQGDFSHTGEFVPGLVGSNAATTAQGVSNDLAAANGLAENVLASQPTVNPDHQVTQANIDRLTPVVDPNLARNAEIDRAFSMSEDLVNRIMGAPSQTGQIADSVLSSQLALGRSSPGGIGNVQAGVKAAMGAAPQLQAQATQASIQEQQARAAAATGAANIYAGVAAGTADRDVRIAEANQGAAMGVIANLTQLTGLDYSFDTAKMGAIGQLTRDYFNNAQAFANMDTQKQIAQWNDLTTRYGIDQNFKAAMEKIAADQNIGPLDAFKMVLGGAQAIGGFAAL